MRFRHTTLAVALVTAACVKNPPTPVKTGGASPHPITVGTVAPASASPTPQASPGGPDVLVAPDHAATQLAGRIALDPSYAGTTQEAKVADGILQLAAGKILANNAANVVNREQAGIIGHNGAGLTGKAKFLSEQGAGVISDHGGGFLSEQGAGIISDNGAGLVSNNGGGIISNYSGGFGLLQAAEGTIPAAGMLIAVRSLTDGAYVPLGVDRRGKPVYAVYTNAKGEFQVYLPPNLARNVMVVAAAPGTKDDHLAVDALTQLTAGNGLVVDELTTLMTGYLRATIIGQLKATLAPDACTPPSTLRDSLKFALGGVASTYADDFGSAAFRALPAAAQERVVGRLVDAVLARTDIEGVQIVPEEASHSTATGSAFATLRDVMAKMQTAAAARLAKDPAFFDDRPYVRVANLEHPDQPLKFRTGADLTEFVNVRNYATVQASNAFLDAVLIDLGLSRHLRYDIGLAGGSMLLGVLPQLTNPDAVALNRKVVQTAIADEAAQLDPAEQHPCVPAPTPPALAADVGTLADLSDGGERPAGLAYDPRGFVYYTDLATSRVRRINLNDAAHPIATVAEGFAGPRALALDASGTLFLADWDHNKIVKITGADGATPQVTVVAGDKAGDFKRPSALTVGKDGTIFVADTDNDRIRKVTAAGEVSTFNRSGETDGVSKVEVPLGITFAPDGNLVVAARGNRGLRVVAMDGTASPLTSEAGSPVKDGTLYNATFDWPSGITAAADGTLYVTDERSHMIRVVQPRGFVSTLAGSEGQAGFADGKGAAARFSTPRGIAIGKDGVLYVADTENHRIRTVTPPR